MSPNEQFSDRFSRRTPTPDFVTFDIADIPLSETLDEFFERYLFWFERGEINTYLETAGFAARAMAYKKLLFDHRVGVILDAEDN